MGNNDIGLLKYCFSIFGQKSRKESEEWIQKAAECMKKAGAQNIKADHEKGELYFCIKNSTNEKKCSDFRYKVKILPGGRQMMLEQDVLWDDPRRASRLMHWYAGKRNESLSKGMKYSLSPIHLEAKMTLRNSWETDLIRKTADMSHVIMEDQEIFELLNQGEVPEIIQTDVRREYREYEREINHGVDI